MALSCPPLESVWPLRVVYVPLAFPWRPGPETRIAQVWTLLASHGLHHPSYASSTSTWPYIATQEGIGEALGISRANAAMVTTRGWRLGIIGRALRHVVGCKRRRQVCYPRWPGEQSAMSLYEVAPAKALDSMEEA